MILTRNVLTATDTVTGHAIVLVKETEVNATTAVNLDIKLVIARRDPEVHTEVGVEAEVEAPEKETIPKVQAEDLLEDQEVPKRTEVEVEARAEAQAEAEAHERAPPVLQLPAEVAVAVEEQPTQPKVEVVPVHVLARALRAEVEADPKARSKRPQEVEVEADPKAEVLEKALLPIN